MFSNNANELLTEQFTISSQDYLHSQANRYRARRSHRSGPGVTLLFAHALGFHKEHWGPAIRELFRADLESGYPVIKEAWAVDFPNHGQSAALNEDELRRRASFVSCGTCSNIFSALLYSGLIDRKDEIIFVGHSAGATVGVLSTLNHGPHEIPYRSMILVEPMMFSQYLLATNSHVQKWVTGMPRACMSRKDAWPSIGAAKSWLMARAPWNAWDPRVLDMYVHAGGLSQQSPSIDEGVTLTLPKYAQSASFADVQTQHDGFEQLRNLPRSGVPIHVIFGSRPDYIPNVIRDNIAAVVGEFVSCSVSYMQNASHEIVQECPERLARALLQAITRDYVHAIQSRL
ncbi:hypothetical protein ONZ45_g426 [Pleurotus djamor]|nr:hypothetical protein ONZ45_g426 [Pleurotus djamor]